MSDVDDEIPETTNRSYEDYGRDMPKISIPVLKKDLLERIESVQKSLDEIRDNPSGISDVENTAKDFGDLLGKYMKFIEQEINLLNLFNAQAEKMDKDFSLEVSSVVHSAIDNRFAAHFSHENAEINPVSLFDDSKFNVSDLSSTLNTVLDRVKEEFNALVGVSLANAHRNGATVDSIKAEFLGKSQHLLHFIDLVEEIDVGLIKDSVFGGINDKFTP